MKIHSLIKTYYLLYFLLYILISLSSLKVVKLFFTNKDIDLWLLFSSFPENIEESKSFFLIL